jgi:hypothetical protein
VKGPKPAVVFGKIGREGLCGSGNTGILVYWEEPGNIGPGVGGGGGGVFAGQPIFLIQSKIQMSLYIWLYCSSFA